MITRVSAAMSGTPIVGMAAGVAPAGSFCLPWPSPSSNCGQYDVAGSYGDDNLSPGVSLLEVADSLGNLAQRVGPIDDRRDLPGLEQLPQDGQVGFVLVGQEEDHPLAHGR